MLYTKGVKHFVVDKNYQPSSNYSDVTFYKVSVQTALQALAKITGINLDSNYCITK